MHKSSSLIVFRTLGFEKNMPILFLIFLILNRGITVSSQGILESSGEEIVSAISLLESYASGEGPVSTTSEKAVILLDSDIEIRSNQTDDDTNSTETTTLEDFLTTTTTAAPTTSTTTTTTTTTVPTTTTTEAPTTTTTEATTTAATTTQSTTTTTTTVKPTTPSTTTTTTEAAKPTTVKSTTVVPPAKTPETPLGAPCEFLDEDFSCDIEVSCFGGGYIDCTQLDYQEPGKEDIKDDKYLPVTEEPDEYEEESATIGFFPPDLVGKKSTRRFPPLWKIGDISPTESNNITTELEEQTTTSTTTMEPSSTKDSKLTTELQPTTTSKILSTLLDITSTEAFTTSTATSLTTKLSTTTRLNNSSQTDDEDSNAEFTTTANSTADGDEMAKVATEISVSTTLIRKRRDSLSLDSSVSESLQLQSVVNSIKSKVKTCKVTGNLYCLPAVTTAHCRGKGRCQVITVEKSEKTSSSKGVENWAIAVIAICATAAALTIGLLAYLVITSWKKLKVQPQNGVTSLTYVNSTPP